MGSGSRGGCPRGVAAGIWVRDHSGLNQGRGGTEQCAGDILKTEPTVDWSRVMMERSGLGPRESGIESEHGAGTLLSSFSRALWPLQPLSPRSIFRR